MIPFAALPFVTGVLLRVPHDQFDRINKEMEREGFKRDFAGMDKDDPAFDLLTYRKPKNKDAR